MSGSCWTSYMRSLPSASGVRHHRPSGLHCVVCVPDQYRFWTPHTVFENNMQHAQNNIQRSHHTNAWIAAAGVDWLAFSSWVVSMRVSESRWPWTSGVAGSVGLASQMFETQPCICVYVCVRWNSKPPASTVWGTSPRPPMVLGDGTRDGEASNSSNRVVVDTCAYSKPLGMYVKVYNIYIIYIYIYL